MKRILSITLAALLILGVVSFSAVPAQAAVTHAEWSILWLIIPELDATVGGTAHKSTTSQADVDKMKAAAVNFKADVEAAIADLNGLALDLDITVIESDMPLRRFSGNSPSYRPTTEDISEILDKYAPNRQGDYDSLIVMAEFPGLHGYGGINMGWMSFCPLPYSANDFLLGYNIQVHEWLHQMDQISNGILQMQGSSAVCPTADDLQSGNYIDTHLKNEYPALTGELFLRQYYFEHLAGTLPVGTLAGKTTTTGFQKEYWAARPTVATPVIAFSFTDGDGDMVTLPSNGLCRVAVMPDDVKVVFTYGYTIKLNTATYYFALFDGADNKIMDIEGSHVNLASDNVTLTVDLQGAVEAAGKRLNPGNYSLGTYPNIAPTDSGSFFNPAMGWIPFAVTTDGTIPDPPPEPPEGGNGTISLTDAPAPHINLAAETIDPGITVAAYSLDGGKKWKKGSLPEGKKLEALFNKGFELHVASAWNDKDIKENKKLVEKKGVPTNATIIKFPKIDKRPKSNPEKLKPFYGEENWQPRKNGIGELTTPSDYEWAASTDGKTPSGAWAALDGDGFSIKEPGTKETVLLRTVPVAENGKYVPACKPFKIKPKAMGKAPNLKANDKKGILKLKKGMYYQASGEVSGGASSGATELKIVASASGSGQVTGGSIIVIWTAATGKKPPSAKQTLTLPAASSES